MIPPNTGQGHLLPKALLALPYLWATLILVGTSWPYLPAVGPQGTDRLLHFGAYLIFGLLCFPYILRSGKPVRTAFLSFLFILLFAAADELHQLIVPGRYPDRVDWVADSLGAATGISLILMLNSRRRILQ